MSKRPIVIHVPKTGGTTLFMAISGSPKPPSPNLLYRHIKMFGKNEEMKSNCGDIFDSTINSKYQENQIIMMIRNPLERIESEFGFLSNREMFRELWQNNVGCEYPKTLLEYIQHPSNANSICRFLHGIPMYTNDPVTQVQYDDVIKSFEKLSFVFGRTDQMGLTVSNVSNQCGIEFGDMIPRYRTSLYKPKRSNHWETISNTFDELNTFDLKLEIEIQKRFLEQTKTIPRSKQVTFAGDEYDSLYPFVCVEPMRSPLEIYANDLDDPIVLYNWIEQNRKLQQPILKKCIHLNKGDGKAFLIDWLNKTIPTMLKDETIKVDCSNPLDSLRLLVKKMFRT